MSSAFNTIANVSLGEYKEKGSKFIAYAHPVSNEAEVKPLVKQYKKEFYAARHHCYAFMLGAEKKHFRATDDGEPSNSAGNSILGQIKAQNLTNILIIVMRYFGGTKLGVPGLINAYRSATSEAISNAEVIKDYPYSTRSLVFEYDKMDIAMKTIKEYKLDIISQEMSLNCKMSIKIKDEELSLVDEILGGFYLKKNNNTL